MLDGHGLASRVVLWVKILGLDEIVDLAATGISGGDFYDSAM